VLDGKENPRHARLFHSFDEALRALYNHFQSIVDGLRVAA
jgi:hypothetical protein